VKCIYNQCFSLCWLCVYCEFGIWFYLSGERISKVANVLARDRCPRGGATVRTSKNAGVEKVQLYEQFAVILQRNFT